MALVEGRNYHLTAAPPNSTTTTSTRPLKGSQKSVIFVKLTDSALKAIEDYLRGQQKTGQKAATLQFLGNEGHINIPSSQAFNASHTFDFSLSSNADIEGPQGSFECIQQCGPSSLESMGNVPFKMRIQAKDDVYETTRQRMNALEETRKHDCAKEIKPNGADIGRKVKKKVPRDSILPSVVNTRKEPSPVYNSNHYKSSYQANNYNNNSVKTSALGLTTQQTNSSNHNHSNPTLNNHSSGNSIPLSNQYHSNISKYSKDSIGHSTEIKSSGSSDVSRRPLRERLLHLLALKPFKKPELISRLLRDGLKDKEKKMVMTILNQLTCLKNNEYILHHGLWNDVQEEWPYYSEQERQTMKRRKPQNLTPPGSDCSVGSGASYSSLSPRSSVSNSGHSPPGSYSHHLSGLKSSTMPHSDHISNNYMLSNLHSGSRPPSADILNSGRNKPLQNLTPPGSDSSSVGSVASLSSMSPCSSASNGSGNSPPSSYGYKPNPTTNSEPTNENYLNNSKVKRTAEECDIYDDESSVKRQRISRCNLPSDETMHVNDTLEFDIRKYTTIRAPEQRSRYKAEFNKDYKEYIKLHSVIDKVSKHFAHLEDRLKQAEHGSQEYEGIKEEIVQEYNSHKTARNFVETKKKFTQLHEKLSRIKKLVMEYDSMNSSISQSSGYVTQEDFY